MFTCLFFSYLNRHRLRYHLLSFFLFNLLYFFRFFMFVLLLFCLTMLLFFMSFSRMFMLDFFLFIFFMIGSGLFDRDRGWRHVVAWFRLARLSMHWRYRKGVLSKVGLCEYQLMVRLTTRRQRTWKMSIRFRTALFYGVAICRGTIL